MAEGTVSMDDEPPSFHTNTERASQRIPITLNAYNTIEARRNLTLLRECVRKKLNSSTYTKLPATLILLTPPAGTTSTLPMVIQVRSNKIGAEGALMPSFCGTSNCLSSIYERLAMGSPAKSCKSRAKASTWH
ncbi:uncharacterized protein EKO05_0009381 [Ascochyta rabiei]|uniref:uncharacterized protein n=1 Tax=Didymella rabiei TaxID=5454 RepID=UPI0022023EDE|nr:uncharacterized protein EKO05_0009381 [Ascochyta rabiei]UPX19108.1 hypothetical protein EKO05_0009381 [Ascochyta rabiei]